jgi:protein dithiol oxidoreductase (disulfide-forming)
MTQARQARRRALVATLALAPWLPALAQRPGADYTVLDPPLSVETPGKIEVIEFFWYGCPACYKLEPLLEAWVPKLPADALFRRIAAPINPRAANDAGIFYAFDAMGVLEKVHGPFFDAIHKDGLRTDNAAALLQWVERKNIDVKKFEDMTKSFGVQGKVRRATQQSAAYRIAGTPTLAVHGRYTISVDQSQRQLERMIATADHLVGVTRTTLAAKKP